MSKRHLLILLALAMTASAATISGCGSSTTASSNTATAAKATVQVQAVFPGTEADKTAAVKSLIPTDTQVIYVYASQAQINTQDRDTLYMLALNAPKLVLTRQSPSGTLNLTPGNWYLYAAALDSTEVDEQNVPIGNILATTLTAGVVKTGVNSVNLTFMDGTWTLVNSNDQATPITLSDNETQLSAIELSSASRMINPSKKAAFDTSKPLAFGALALRYVLNNNDYAYSYTDTFFQFLNSTSSNAIDGGWYNLTKQCSDSYYDNYYGYASKSVRFECNEENDDKVIFLYGASDAMYSSISNQDPSSLLQGSAESKLPATFFKNSSGNSLNLESNFTVTSVAGGATMTGSLIEAHLQSTPAYTLKGVTAFASKTGVTVKKATQSSNTSFIGVKKYESGLMICATSNLGTIGDWSFYGEPVINTDTARCYAEGYLEGSDAGSYSYGLEPTSSDLGDYCHVWNYNDNTCTQQAPLNGDIYLPWNFRAVKTAEKTSINYGSFRFKFYVQNEQTADVYVYPLRAKGTSSIQAVPVKTLRK